MPRCHGRKAEIVGTDGDDVLRGTPERDVIVGGPGDDVIFSSLGNDLICGGPGTDRMQGGRGNDEVYGDAGDEDQVSGNLGDDKIVGGPGARDEVAGDLGIDIVNGGPGNEDHVHGDYGYDRMSGGAGRGDIASFATARAGGKGSGVWVSLKAHKAFGDGHDKLFGFESLEGSAFRDTLIGSPQANVIAGGTGDDHLIGGGGPDTLDGGQGIDGCEGAKGRTSSCGKEAPPKATAYVQLNPTPGGGAGLQIIGGGGRDQFVVAFDEASQTFSITGEERGGDRGRLRPRGQQPPHHLLPRQWPGSLADGRPRSRQRQPAWSKARWRRWGACASPAASATTRSKVAPRTI